MIAPGDWLFLGWCFGGLLAYCNLCAFLERE